jgi:hypothetical protein
MAIQHRTARGEPIDMDMLRLANENVIAVGNMKTNARGDELGPGGKVVKTRAQIMQDYHKLNSQPADSSSFSEALAARSTAAQEKTVSTIKTPVVDDTPFVAPSATPEYVKPRGSFAEAVAGETEITQELLEPAASRSSDSGVSRI